MAKAKFDNDGNEIFENKGNETPTAHQFDPMEVLASLAASMKILAERQQATPGVDANDLMAKLAGAMDRIADAQLTGAELMASETRRAHRPSNEVVPAISVFNRRGMLVDEADRKPPLKCIMLLPWLAEWESLSTEEVKLLNLLQPGTYVLSRIDKSKVKVMVQIEYGVDEVTPSRLLLNHDTAFNNDNFRLIPDMAGMVRNLLNQHEPAIRRMAAAVLTDDEEAAMIAAGELTVSV